MSSNYKNNSSYTNIGKRQEPYIRLYSGPHPIVRQPIRPFVSRIILQFFVRTRIIFYERNVLFCSSLSNSKRETKIYNLK